MNTDVNETMYPKGTMYLLKNLVIFENLFCVNRSYLVRERKKRLLCYILFTTSFIIMFGGLINDYVVAGLPMTFHNKLIQIYNAIELLILASGARMKKTFVTQDRLDLKCGLDDNYVTKLRAMANTALIVNVISVVLNLGGSLYLDIKICIALIFCYTAAVHDMEIDLIRLLIEGYNLRLMSLKDVTPNAGCRIYRYVLIAASQLGEEFNLRILMMLTTTLIKTVSYSVVAILADAEPILITFLLIRQLKVLYSLTMFCRAAANTECIRKNLQFHLATNLVLDPLTSKECNAEKYKITRRFYKIVLTERPQYISGAIKALDLNIPLRLIDVSVNYLLIIIQVYAAFKT